MEFRRVSKVDRSQAWTSGTREQCRDHYDAHTSIECIFHFPSAEDIHVEWLLETAEHRTREYLWCKSLQLKSSLTESGPLAKKAPFLG